MKRQITGLRAASDVARLPDGLFLVRVQNIKFKKHAPKPYYTISVIVQEPQRFAGGVVSSRLYCSPRALWKLNWFLRDFGYDTESIERDELEERQVWVRSDQSLGGAFTGQFGTAGIVMIYSYTQINQYLTCPRRYRYRYVDGWKEKDTRAAMLFGRAFELALAAYFRREDPGEALFREWLLYKEQNLIFSKGDSWDRMLERAIMLQIRFCQDDRVRISNPGTDLQAKFTKSIGKNEFVSYIDGIGTLDGKRCLLEWKTSSARYPEEPAGLLALDPQLVCYSWMTGIEEVAQIVFVRKRFVEIQYLRTTITEDQRRDFGNLVVNTIRRIESAEFLPHSGIRFPQNPCSSCPYVGLCLGRQGVLEPGLVRQPGAEEFGWIDELTY